MTILNHEKLGQLAYDYGWVKTMAIQLNKHSYTIRCNFDCYEDEEITQAQIISYQSFVSAQENKEQLIAKLLADYIDKNEFENAKVKPTCLLFKQNGGYGLLCDCSWDIEHGIVVYLSPEERVTIQDDIL
ncbi:hypothetical protein [Lonepinella sp. BR2923]